MFFRLWRRAIFGGIGFFALLGFASVPLGDKTGWGHLQAIAATPAASHALDELKESAGQFQHRFIGWITSRLHPTEGSETPPAVSALPNPGEDSVPHKTKSHHWGSPPIPTPPTPTN